jgi:ABC-2 type transport system ATP-binding protein
MFLEFDKISFSYPEVLALDGVSFKVARGEIVGLIGANGAGKTTAILHIIRYLNPKSGKIRMDGVDISKIKNEDFPVSYIPDTPVFYEELTLLEHLHFLKALYPDNKLSIDEIIDRLEIHDHLHKVPSALSKGTKQKLMIALALLRRYELLIADEPFSGLDPKQIGIFRQVLEECRQEQKAVLLSTHLLDMVDGTCDRYIMLHRGKLIAIGTKQDIIQRHALDPDSTLEQVYLTLVGKEI